MTKFTESQLLARLCSRANQASDYIIEGVRDQDDCAVLSLPSGYELCVTTDFVRGTGFFLFKKGYLSFKDIGYYVVAANLSDLASMGAEAIGYLSVIRYDKSRKIEDVEYIMEGILDACSFYSCPLIGGDSGSYEADVLSGTALGIAPIGKRLSRSNVAAGHAVFVSGDIGRPAAAISAATNNLAEKLNLEFSSALQKWKRPIPRLALGKSLSLIDQKIGCMDVSDGLAASLQQLSRITGLGFEIFADKLPIDSSVIKIANELETDFIDLACSASVDFELLFTAPIECRDIIFDVANQCSTQVSHIGQVTENPDLLMVKPDCSTYRAFPGTPWDHQLNTIEEAFKKHGKN